MTWPYYHSYRPKTLWERIKSLFSKHKQAEPEIPPDKVYRAPESEPLSKKVYQVPESEYDPLTDPGVQQIMAEPDDEATRRLEAALVTQTDNSGGNVDDEDLAR